jgi:hypothetical protein
VDPDALQEALRDAETAAALRVVAPEILATPRADVEAALAQREALAGARFHTLGRWGDA